MYISRIITIVIYTIYSTIRFVRNYKDLQASVTTITAANASLAVGTM